MFGSCPVLPYQFAGVTKFLANEVATLISPRIWLKNELHRTLGHGLAKILEANQTGLVDYGFANFLVRLWLAQNQNPRTLNMYM
jgi:hypothetical protein